MANQLGYIVIGMRWPDGRHEVYRGEIMTDALCDANKALVDDVGFSIGAQWEPMTDEEGKAFTGEER